MVLFVSNISSLFNDSDISVLSFRREIYGQFRRRRSDPPCVEGLLVRSSAVGDYPSS